MERENITERDRNAALLAIASSVASRHDAKAALKRKSRAGMVPPPIRGPPMAYTVAAFAQAHGISVAFYYKLKQAGLGPTEMRLGARVLVTSESAARWRAEREAATNA